MRIAFVYDRVNKFGGAERVLLALHEIWPDAPLFTAVYNRQNASWADVFQVKTSFLRHIPVFSAKHEVLPLLTPLAFESFNFDGYDVVLSLTSAEAKNIVTKPTTFHVCYCLTPTRYLWSGYQEYIDEPGVGVINPIARVLMKFFSPHLRQVDYIASSRPDMYIAISKEVAMRLCVYYRKKADVLYPPIDTKRFTVNNNSANGQYYLIVSRLVPYKKIDYVIAAFNKLKYKLIIIGNGIDRKRLESLADNNIQFIDNHLTDEKLCWYYQNCKALIFPGEEDFGLTSIEAQACGRPVIALGCAGVRETVISGITGEFYNKQTIQSLSDAVSRLVHKRYSPLRCRQNALRFSYEAFQLSMKEKIENSWNQWREML